MTASICEDTTENLDFECNLHTVNLKQSNSVKVRKYAYAEINCFHF
jgi:hypothetical protein